MDKRPSRPLYVPFFWHEIAQIRENNFMINLLERIGIVQRESNRSFKMLPAIIMLLLMVTFVGTTLYILFSSMSG